MPYIPTTNPDRTFCILGGRVALTLPEMDLDPVLPDARELFREEGGGHVPYLLTFNPNYRGGVTLTLPEMDMDPVLPVKSPGWGLCAISAHL